MRAFILFFFLLFLLLLPVGNILAADTPPPATGAEAIELNNPLSSGRTDAPSLIGQVIKGILSVIGAVVLLMFVWGAQAWLTAAGNPEKIKSGSKTMIFAALGALIVFFSYLFLDAVLTNLLGG